MGGSKNLSGMTLNERLFALNLFTKFDKAVKDRNRIQLLEILRECQLDEERANASLEEILNPSVRTPYFKLQSRKLLFSYLFVYPIYFVLAMAVGTIILFLILDWTLEYAIAWFKVSSVIMGGASYVINWRIGFFAFLELFSKR